MTRDVPGKAPASPREWLELAANTLLALCGLALVYYLAYRHPVGYVYFVVEDRWVEYGSFVSWAIACGLMAWVLFKHRGLRRPGFFLFALAAFLIAMDEISWGQRIVGLPTPGFLARSNRQGELTLHNLSGVSLYYRTFAAALVLWCVGPRWMAARLVWARRWCDRLGIPVVPIRLWPFFFLPVYFVFSRDLFEPLPKANEIIEFYAGFAIAALAVEIALTASRGARDRGAAAVFATAGLLLTTGVLTGSLIWAFTSPQAMKQTLNSFAEARYPRAGMPRQAEMVFEYINRNPQFLMTDTRIHEGEFFLETGRREKAVEVLELALGEQERLQRQNPEDVEPLRNGAKVLALLGRRQEADRVFQEALAKDRARLQAANDTEKEAMIRWSLAKTLLAMGDPQGASREAATARGLTSLPRSRDKIDGWLKDHLGKGPDLE